MVGEGDVGKPGVGFAVETGMDVGTEAGAEVGRSMGVGLAEGRPAPGDETNGCAVGEGGGGSESDCSPILRPMARGIAIKIRAQRQ